MASNTPYYNLPLFDTGDAANLRDNYNSAMNIIDQRLHILETKINLIYDYYTAKNND